MLDGAPGRAATSELWIACHGYGQLAESFARALEPLNDGRRTIVVPEALSRFYLEEPFKRHGPDSPIGASWMTREDREAEIIDYVEYLDVVAETLTREIGGTPALVGLGFSQGVATVARWAALGRSRVARLILWGGSVPADLPRGAGAGLFRGAAVTLVGGEKDQLISPSALERERASLAQLGIAADVLSHGGGHSLNADLLRRVATPSAQ